MQKIFYKTISFKIALKITSNRNFFECEILLIFCEIFNIHVSV